MELELKQKIEKTVREILQEANMDETTEYQIREAASAKLGFDLSKPEHKGFVRRVVNCFLEEENAKEIKELEENAKQQVEEEEGEEEEERGVAVANDDKEYDDDGDLIVCRLSDKRRVTIQNFRGRNLVSIREFYKKDGKELPSNKGISLTDEQWGTLRNNVSAIEKAVDKMNSRLM
ncbi:RNA polymerase II transcriptional coactivator KELP-like [Tripterygium wilfordii]|uniref:RNA polymerase II transcriptional coactivator KELP-like n=1 Tax=Tripterygium wilfordii TaxID=458696 RepID=A0A7J7C6K1_TRIWF|nr:RNA polymerase II transcriptional coactivator KELP [Tripterygium wilfordii]KAF5729759.1 RNA polymerase II transcriptional coactivator KELP-like [Tripterygium wilfordii]